jgi:hypothetical protein
MVEFAGFFGHSAETVRGWLAKYNLRVSAPTRLEGGCGVF